ncbi:MAG TPA: LUD domain-containing protein [Chloroflexota bacterium]|nr:LUD domain-containing protein [Chloroflexota bacterium]
MLAPATHLVARFVAQAEAVGARVMMVAAGELVGALEDAAEGAHGLGVTTEVRRHWPLSRAIERRGGEWPEVAVSLSPLGIAAAGSVVVAERTYRDRLLCLLCVRHIVILHHVDLVEDTAAAMPWLGAHPEHRYVTFVTGPSRTSDIERILSVGVHGPRELVILLTE